MEIRHFPDSRLRQTWWNDAGVGHPEESTYGLGPPAWPHLEASDTTSPCERLAADDYGVVPGVIRVVHPDISDRGAYGVGAERKHLVIVPDTHRTRADIDEPENHRTPGREARHSHAEFRRRELLHPGDQARRRD